MHKKCGVSGCLNPNKNNSSFCEIHHPVMNVKDAISTITKDTINPDHYKSGGIETIEYMQAKMTPVQFEGYLLGNVLKYTSRYQFKNGIEDLRKAEWYLEKMIQTLESR